MILLLRAPTEPTRFRALRLKLLQALLEGESVSLAAETVGIHYGTARDHVAALRRLNGNITGVVVLALTQGLITLPKWMQPEPRQATLDVSLPDYLRAQKGTRRVP